jgi:hypothetical protein
MSDTRIGTIAVVGDGVAGWSAAAALKSRVPGISVALIPVAELRPGFVDLFGGASPSIGEFHTDIGLDERDVLTRTGASIRLGTRFVGWSGTNYTHAYGPAGMPVDGVASPSVASHRPPRWRQRGGSYHLAGTYSVAMPTGYSSIRPSIASSSKPMLDIWA